MINDSLNKQVRQKENRSARNVPRKRSSKDYLRVADNTLRNWKNAGILKVHKVDGILYYKLKDIRKIYNILG